MKSAQKYPISKMLASFGGDIEVLGDVHARGTLPLTELVMQPTQVYHAGAIIALADEVASAAIYGVPGGAGPDVSKPFPYSIQISTNLLTNDPHGPITAESKVIKRGKVTVVETEVHNSQGKLMTLVRSTHLIVDLTKTGPHKREILDGRG